MPPENKVKHTPGPWTTAKQQNNLPGIYGGMGGHLHIAEISGIEGESDGNAALIAAAPDLLDALENAVYLANIYAKKDGDGLMVSAFQDILNRGQKAISKATP